MIDRWTGTLVRACSTLAAFWAMFLGFLILYDILGREIFNSPLAGTVELVANSIVCILFLQIPYAIHSGAHIRTLLIYQNAGDIGRRAIDVLAYLLGIFFFLAVVEGGWTDMITGWEVGEYEGEGALRVPTYPVRSLIILFAALSALVYLLLMIGAITGRRAGSGSDGIQPS